MNWAPAMAGLAVTIVMIPLSTVVGKALAKARREQVGTRRSGLGGRGCAGWGLLGR